ncbi:MAG: PA2779 family protein [Longimicrobiales bacterium]|nr:PA2779 family protein [Longimicrobiales bacterium]
MRFTVLLALAATLTFTSGLEAQDAMHPDVRQELRALVAEDARAADDREVILEFLEREDVQQVAGEQGVDVERARRAVQTLGNGAAADLARTILDADSEGDLVGGDTVVISTTTIIIVLLVLILLSV